MGRTRTISIAGLNVAMHAPHSPGRYTELLQAIFKRRAIARIGKIHGAMLGSLYPVDKDDLTRGFNGEIYRFLKLDPSEPWFNVVTRKAATSDEVGEVKIPQHLLPHLQRIPFTFNPKRHLLYFVSKDRGDSLSPAVAKRILDQLISPLIESRQFPHVEITPLPDQETLEKIFSLPTLDSLVISLVRPNADDADAEQRRWMKKLADQKSRRMEVKLTAEPNSTIKPDAETRSMAEVASTNGKVEAVGRDAGGQRVLESTAVRPLLDPVLVDSDIETTRDVLERYAATPRRR